MAKKIKARLKVEEYTSLISFLLGLTDKEKEMLKAIYLLRIDNKPVTNEVLRKKLGLKSQSVSRRLLELKKKKALNEDNSFTTYTDYTTEITFVCQFT